jgi:hypothetical protein
MLQVAPFPETGVKTFEDGVAERSRVGMGENGQNPHAWLPRLSNDGRKQPAF